MFELILLLLTGDFDGLRDTKLRDKDSLENENSGLQVEDASNNFRLAVSSPKGKNFFISST